MKKLIENSFYLTLSYASLSYQYHTESSSSIVGANFSDKFKSNHRNFHKYLVRRFNHITVWEI